MHVVLVGINIDPAMGPGLAAPADLTVVFVPGALGFHAHVLGLTEGAELSLGDLTVESEHRLSVSVTVLDALVGGPLIDHLEVDFDRRLGSLSLGETDRGRNDGDVNVGGDLVGVSSGSIDLLGLIKDSGQDRGKVDEVIHGTGLGLDTNPTIGEIDTLDEPSAVEELLVGETVIEREVPVLIFLDPEDPTIQDAVDSFHRGSQGVGLIVGNHAKVLLDSIV